MLNHAGVVLMNIMSIFELIEKSEICSAGKNVRMKLKHAISVLLGKQNNWNSTILTSKIWRQKKKKKKPKAFNGIIFLLKKN